MTFKINDASGGENGYHVIYSWYDFNNTHYKLMIDLSSKAIKEECGCKENRINVY